MEPKINSKLSDNPETKTPFLGSWRFVHLSILLAAVIFLFPACDISEQTSQTIVQPEGDITEQLPEGEGLAIGALAPEFSLLDAEGNTHRLSDYSGKKLVIVFYRTGT